MRGYIREKSKGSWQIQVSTGLGTDGKYHYQYERIRGRKSDAQKRLNELLVTLDKGIYVAPVRRTLAEHLQNWLREYVKTNCSQRTLDGYRSIIETHLIPALGNIQLKYLQPAAIQCYY